MKKNTCKISIPAQLVAVGAATNCASIGKFTLNVRVADTSLNGD